MYACIWTCSSKRQVQGFIEERRDGSLDVRVRLAKLSLEKQRGSETNTYDFMITDKEKEEKLKEMLLIPLFCS